MPNGRTMAAMKLQGNMGWALVVGVLAVPAGCRGLAGHQMIGVKNYPNGTTCELYRVKVGALAPGGPGTRIEEDCDGPKPQGADVPRPPDGPVGDTGGCRKDTDCKGDRICENGRCVGAAGTHPAPDAPSAPAPPAP